MAPRISIDQLVAWTPSKIQSGFVDGQGLIVDHTPDSWTYVGEPLFELEAGCGRASWSAKMPQSIEAESRWTQVFGCVQYALNLCNHSDLG